MLDWSRVRCWDQCLVKNLEVVHIELLRYDKYESDGCKSTDRKFERLLLMFILVPHQVDPVLPGLEEELEEEERSDLTV